MQSALSPPVLLAVHAGSLLALLPIVILGRPDHALALLLLPVGWMGLMLHRRPAARKSPLSLPLGVLGLGLALSLVATPDLRWSYPKIAGLVYGIALYFAFLEWGTSEQAWCRLALGVALAGGAVAVLALFGTAWPAKIPLLTGFIDTLPRLPWALPGAEDGFHPNEVAGTLLWTVPLAWPLAFGLWAEGLRGPGRRRWGRLLGAFAFTLAAAAVPLGAMLLTQSRGGWFGLVAAGGVVLTGLAPRHYRIAAGLLLAAVLVVVVFLSLEGTVLEAAADLAPDALSTGTLDFRLAVWSQALKGISDFPITGMGMNVFRQAIHVLYPTPLVDPSMNLGHAHNIFLQTALDLGLVGLVGYVALWISALTMVWQCGRSAGIASRSALLRLGTAGLAASLAGYGVYGMLDAVTLGARPGFLWWGLLGLVGSLYRLQHPDPIAQR